MLDSWCDIHRCIVRECASSHRYATWLAEPSQRYRATQELLAQLAVRDIERSLRLGRLVGL